MTRAGQQAQQAAVKYAEISTSVDSNKVDENFNQVLDGATGEFKDMYSQSSMQLRQLLIDNKAAATGSSQNRRSNRRRRARSSCCSSSTNRCRIRAFPIRESTAAESR